MALSRAAGMAVVAQACAYLLGSIPFAHLVTRWRTGLNIRQVGIGNAGARVEQTELDAVDQGLDRGVDDVRRSAYCAP